MYQVKATMGNTIFQVLDWSGNVIQSFYSKNSAEAFADKLTTEEYFNSRDKINKLYSDSLNE